MIDISDDEIEENHVNMENQIRWYVEKEGKFTVPIEKRDVNLVFSLLDISYDDFTASQILFKKKFYPQSVFFLQQSAEKFGKSLLVLMGFCRDEAELKTRVGHVFTIFLLKKLRSIIPELHNYINLENYLELLPAIDKITSKYRDEVKDNFELKIKFEDFKEILLYFPKIIKMMKKGFRSAVKESIIEETRSILSSNLDRIYEGFKPYFEIELTEEQEKEAKNELKQILEEEDLSIFAIVHFNIVLLFVYISIICYNLEGHVNISRYYLFNNSKYTRNSSIVQISPYIVKTLKQMLLVYEETLYMCLADSDEESEDKDV